LSDGFLFSMGRKKNPKSEKILIEFKKLKRRASTRTKIYKDLANKFRVTEAYVRLLVSRAGLTSREHSLMYAFSVEEEEALANVCIAYARQGKPFTIPDFIAIASIFKGKTNNGDFFSRYFVRSFHHRHSDIISVRKGKVTSPTRNPGRMLEMTQDFIGMLNSRMLTNTINKRNLFVFDETIIGDSISLPLVIGERRNSGGGTINVIQTREKALGSYIPFSMPDGSTPFRVYIFKVENMKNGQEVLDVVVPKHEYECRSQPHRVFLASKTGYLTIELFKRIMDEFTKWWTTTRPGLDCYLISDNLPAHKNKDIVEIAKANGIHMYNIMPGSSHWFQVHDQKPFGSLKKKMREKKFQFLSLISLPRNERRDLLTCIFYQAEAEALETHIVSKTFAEVGLWPWNPDHIIEICREHYYNVGKIKQSPMMRKLLCIIRKVIQLKEDKARQLLCSMKRARVEIVQKTVEKEGSDEESLDFLEDEDQEEGEHEIGINNDSPLERPAKRQRIMRCCGKPCCAEGCQKTRFWSKKWVTCPKCERNFCPSHAHLIHQHKC